MPPFQILELHGSESARRHQLDCIMDIIWAAMDGSEPSFRIFYPVLPLPPPNSTTTTTATSSPSSTTTQQQQQKEARAASIAVSKTRTFDDHVRNLADTGTDHWIYAQDVESGIVVGACQWRIYATPEAAQHALSPEQGGGAKKAEGSKEGGKDDEGEGAGAGTGAARKEAEAEAGKKEQADADVDADAVAAAAGEATWYPAGPMRAFATEYLRQTMQPRRRAMGSRAHVGLSWMAVHPEWRRRGAGRLLMDWGLAKADALGLESWVEASDDGRWLYKECGFGDVEVVRVLMDKEGDDGEGKEGGEEWRSMWTSFFDKGPVGFTSMWRPAVGASGGGKTLTEEGEAARIWAERGVLGDT